MNQQILVVDDTIETRKVAKLRLQEAGYQVLTATDGVDALKILENNPNIKLILTDYRMPSLGGDDLIKLLNHHYPSIKKMVFSGYPFVEKQLPKEIPFIPKPIDWERAFKLIEESFSS